MDIDLFQTHAFRDMPQGNVIKQILVSALDAVDPASTVSSYLHRENELLYVGNPAKCYHLPTYRRIFIIGFGKASLPMTRAAVNIIGDRITYSACITNTSIRHTFPITALMAAHPIPNQNNILAGQKILNLLQTTTPDDLVIFLVSGGGSALFTVPSENILLSELQSLTKSLLSCAASIQEINTIRKHLSQVK